MAGQKMTGHSPCEQKPQLIVFSVMLNPVTTQGTGPVPRRIPLRVKLQFACGILKDHILVELN